MAKKNGTSLLLFAFIIAVVGITFFSSSSFFYPINEWQDVNIYYTIGKGISHGLVPYRDLIDQKGPIIFFLYCIAYLLTPNSFVGLSILQICSMTVFLYYIGKIAKMIVGGRFTSFIQITIAVLVFSSAAYHTGGSAEEFVMALWAISMYDLLRICQSRSIDGWMAWRNGLIIGLVLFIKFNLLGFWAMLCITAIIVVSLKKKIRSQLQMMSYFILGFFLITLAVLFYYLINGAIQDLFLRYFYDNLFLYSSIAKREAQHLEIIEKFRNIVGNVYGSFMQERIFNIIITVGFVVSLNKKTISWIKRHLFMVISAGSSFMAMAAGAYWGEGFHEYYILVFAGFLVFPLCAFAVWAEGGYSKLLNICKNRVVWVVATYLLIAFVFTWNLSSTTQNFMKPKEETIQFKVASHIEEGSTLLNYGFLDSGFYFASKTLPNVPYFFRMNFTYEELPNMYDAQKKYVEDGLCRYVVTRQKSGEDISDITKINPDYVEIYSATDIDGFHNIEMTYRLYCLKG